MHLQQNTCPLGWYPLWNKSSAITEGVNCALIFHLLVEFEGELYQLAIWALQIFTDNWLLPLNFTDYWFFSQNFT